ncbi:energy transducer TonB [Vibrio diabolicus]|uniref:energy transducer TonB n=1 Tax=Vibrio diabolicus TaxID=50719 RepID=UPI001CD91B2D|nr:TonB family protein [Vibrio diabolicus]
MKILILFIAALLSGCAGLIESASSPNYREHKARDSVSPRNHKGSRKNKLVGTVVLTFNINSQGDVIDIMVTDSVPKGVFDAEAVRILSKRKYAPSEKGKLALKKLSSSLKFDT